MIKQIFNAIMRKETEPVNMPKKFDWIIAGLGNPGDKYERTRHNVGWMSALALAQRHNAVFSSGSVYYSAFYKHAGKNILIIMPVTYMNLSGEAVKKAADKYFVPYSKVVAVCDEYNFPVGKVHIKAGGSSGGHNGINSIIEQLGMQNFFRLRCGIGKKFPPGGMVDYVLSEFDAEDASQLKEMIEKSCDAIDYLIKIGPARAVSEINSEKLWKPEDSSGGDEQKNKPAEM